MTAPTSLVALLPTALAYLSRFNTLTFLAALGITCYAPKSRFQDPPPPADSSHPQRSVPAVVPFVPAAIRITRVDEIDSVVNEATRYRGALTRLRVHHAAGVDTLTGVVTNRPVMIVGDTAIYGFTSDEERITGAFLYTTGTRATRALQLPEGFDARAISRIAPTGQYLAYIGRTQSGQTFGAVASWPDGKIVFQSWPASLHDEDKADMNMAGWRDSTHFLIRFSLGRVGSRNTLAVKEINGTVAPRLSVSVDTTYIGEDDDF